MLELHLSKDSRLSEFIKKLDPDLAEPLTDLRKRLVEVIAYIQKMNRLNIYLIESSIKWIEHSVTTIANVLSPESAAYNANGKPLTTSAYSNFKPANIIEHEA